jgi:hypothetical protein
MPIGAVIGGAVIAGGASIAAGSMASHAQSKAADTAAQTAANNTASNNALTEKIYGENASRLDPYSTMGLSAGNEYMGLLGVPTSSPTTSALGTVTPPATGTSALGTHNNSSIAQQAQAAIAAGADPTAVRTRAASMGVAI